MATIMELANAGHVAKYDPQLGWREQEDRCVYLLPSAQHWLSNILPGLASDFKIETDPNEQVFEFLFKFCAGRKLFTPRQVRALRHIDSGIWELKTADIRLFGWFHSVDVFICSNGDLATAVKRGNLYGHYRDEAMAVREALALDEPKFVPGGEPEDVVSAINRG